MSIPPPLPPIEQIRAVRGRIKALLKREERKLAKQREEVAEAAQYARYSQIADSLMADPVAAPRGTSKGEIINIHTEQIEEIALNPAFGAVENAELLYRKSRKGKRGHETAAAMAAETEKNIGKLSGILSEINDLLDTPPLPPKHTEEDVTRVREIAAEFLPEERSAAKGKHAAPAVPFKKIVINNWEIYWGKNSEQNDELSTRFAKPSDIWMHAAGYAGSHVIIRRKKDQPYPPQEVVRKAAQLAVWHSKARNTSYAEVHITEARFVRKRRHAPPGEVIAERCKTVRAEPADPRGFSGCSVEVIP